MISPKKKQSQLHHFSSLVVFLQKSRKAKIAERMEQGLVVAHLQKDSQAAGRTRKIKELLQLAAQQKMSPQPYGERSLKTPPKKESSDFLSFFYKEAQPRTF